MLFVFGNDAIDMNLLTLCGHRGVLVRAKGMPRELSRKLKRLMECRSFTFSKSGRSSGSSESSFPPLLDT